ncbi:MAG: adenylate/guanylate cyclase domain-containing protein [Gaiellaceae bacterium]
MSELPTGTVTFLFTDIEGSTKLLHELGGARYGEVLAEHQRILREAFAAHHGREVDTQGDSFFVAFRRAKDAVAAAVDAQRDLAAGSWPEGTQVKVRMGLHTGEPRVGEERYVGLGVHKAARIGAAGHGGQVLLSRTTRELVEDELPQGVTVRDLGERRLKDLERPERLSQLEIDGLPSEFGPLNTLDVELARKRRRMYIGSALIGVLAAAVAIPVFAFGQGNGGGSANVAPNSVAIIDPASNDVVHVVSNVGSRPGSIAVGQDAVWVANEHERSLARIDPTTLDVQRTTLELTPTGVAVGAGAVWVAHGLLGSVTRVGVDGSVLETIDDVAGRAVDGSIAVGESGVWFVSASGVIAKIDPRTNQVVRPTEVAGALPTAVDTGFDGVWVANAGDNNVVRINPRTLGVVHTTGVGGSPRGIAVGERAIWVTSDTDDSVSRIDAASGSVSTIPVCDGPTGIAFGEGAVWVACSGDGTVSRIDPATAEVVQTIAVGNRPVGIAAGAGSVWVTVQEPVT